MQKRNTKTILWYMFFFCFLIVLSSRASDLDQSQMQELYDKEQYDLLIKNYSSHTGQMDVGGLYLLGQSYQRKKEYDSAIRIYELIIKKNEKEAPAYRKKAEALVEARRYPEAIKNLKKAIELNPKYEVAHVELAETILKYKPKNRADARSIYEDLVKTFGLKLEYQVQICDLSVKEGHHKMATQACQKVLKLNPSNAVALIGLGQILKDQMEFEKSDKYFNKIKNDFLESEQVQFYVGEYFQERGQWPKALESYQRAAELKPKELRYLIAAGRGACELQNLSECFNYFEKACQLDEKAKMELRRSFPLVRAAKNQEQILKFEDLILKCNGNKY